jgi:hypothetical protein
MRGSWFPITTMHKSRKAAQKQPRSPAVGFRIRLSIGGAPVAFPPEAAEIPLAAQLGVATLGTFDETYVAAL